MANRLQNHLAIGKIKAKNPEIERGNQIHQKLTDQGNPNNRVAIKKKRRKDEAGKNERKEDEAGAAPPNLST